MVELRSLHEEHPFIFGGIAALTALLLALALVCLVRTTRAHRKREQPFSLASEYGELVGMGSSGIWVGDELMDPVLGTLRINSAIGDGACGPMFSAKLAGCGRDITVQQVSFMPVHEEQEALAQIADFEEELGVLQALQHEHIVQYLGCVYKPQLCLVFEAAPHGSLFSHLRGAASATFREQHASRVSVGGALPLPSPHAAPIAPLPSQVVISGIVRSSSTGLAT